MDKNKQGIIAAQSGDIKEAQRLFMEAFAETPNNEGLFLNVARSMAMQRKHQELLIYFDHANFLSQSKFRKQFELILLFHLQYFQQIFET